MSVWGGLKQSFLFRVALGYFVLTWLLILTVSIVFPMLELPDGSVTLAISLLVLGFPVVVFLAWTFRSGASVHSNHSATSAAPSTRRSPVIEYAVISVLIAALGMVGLDHYFLEEKSANLVGDELGPIVRSVSVPNAITIGIISPKEGSRSNPTGAAHEASIMLAFNRLGPIRMGTTEVGVRFVGWNDQGNADVSSELALKLAREESAAAILGPVNSNATAAVLAALRSEAIELPVISSLSTASNLIVSGQRDPNFFRLIFNDADRMAAYATYIEAEKRREGDQRFLFLYEDDEYGRGLKDALLSNFYSTNVETATWCSVVEPACTGDDGPACLAQAGYCVDGSLDPASYGGVSSGDAFSIEFVRQFVEHEFDNVVLLGTIPGSVAFANGLSRFDDRLDYFFVGNNKQLFDEAPSGSLAIGNPVLDPSRAPNADLYVVWTDILSEFRDRYGRDPSDFQITSFEAGMVLHSALRTILRGRQELPSLDELRTELLRTLEEQSFDSVEPWRRIQFSDGRLSEPHTMPVYRISRGRVREDDRLTPSWINVDLPGQFNYMEGPIRARLRGYAVDRVRVLLSRFESGRPVLIRSREVELSAGEAEVDFHVFRTGLYSVSVDGANYTPALAETRIVLSPAYALSVVTALIGALIIVLREQASMRERLVRTALGVFAGFALTFSSLYGAQVAGWFPFPSFGEEPNINAAITGLIGGLLGPYVLAEAFLSWALVLSVGPSGKGR